MRIRTAYTLLLRTLILNTTMFKSQVVGFARGVMGESFVEAWSTFKHACGVRATARCPVVQRGVVKDAKTSHLRSDSWKYEQNIFVKF